MKGSNCKEAIAYKHDNEDIWDIFFDFEVYGMELMDDKAKYMLGIGHKILSIKTKDFEL
jgi:hypothetical protein